MNTLNGKDLKKYIFFRLKKCKIVPFCSVAFWVFRKEENMVNCTKSNLLFIMVHQKMKLESEGFLKLFFFLQ